MSLCVSALRPFQEMHDLNFCTLAFGLVACQRLYLSRAYVSCRDNNSRPNLTGYLYGYHLSRGFVVWWGLSLSDYHSYPYSSNFVAVVLVASLGYYNSTKSFIRKTAIVISFEMIIQTFFSLSVLLSGATAFVHVVPNTKPAVSTSTVSVWGVTQTPTSETFHKRHSLNHFGMESTRSSSQLDAAAASADASTPVKLIISGAPASGKGTQCEVIKEKFGVVHLSTGDMLRAAVAAQTEVGKKAKDFMDSGKLVPDDVIIGVVSWQRL